MEKKKLVPNPLGLTKDKRHVSGMCVGKHNLIFKIQRQVEVLTSLAHAVPCLSGCSLDHHVSRNLSGKLVTFYSHWEIFPLLLVQALISISVE